MEKGDVGMTILYRDYRIIILDRIVRRRALGGIFIIIMKVYILFDVLECINNVCLVLEMSLGIN